MEIVILDKQEATFLEKIILNLCPALNISIQQQFLRIIFAN